MYSCDRDSTIPHVHVTAYKVHLAARRQLTMSQLLENCDFQAIAAEQALQVGKFQLI